MKTLYKSEATEAIINILDKAPFGVEDSALAEPLGMWSQEDFDKICEERGEFEDKVGELEERVEELEEQVNGADFLPGIKAVLTRIAELNGVLNLEILGNCEKELSTMVEELG